MKSENENKFLRLSLISSDTQIRILFILVCLLLVELYSIFLTKNKNNTIEFFSSIQTYKLNEVSQNQVNSNNLKQSNLNQHSNNVILTFIRSYLIKKH